MHGPVFGEIINMKNMRNALVPSKHEENAPQMQK